MTRRMAKWTTDSRRGLGVGIGLLVAITLIDVSLIWIASTRPITFGTFTIGLAVLFSLVLLGLLAHWVHGLARSWYLLDRNALIIHWGAIEQVIPMGQIERVLTGNEIEGRFQFYGGAWPGHHVGHGYTPGEGATLFYSTAPPEEQVYIITPGLVYGLSPADREGFLESLRQRWEMGTTQVVERSTKRPSFLNWEIWGDALGLALLGVGVAAALALVGYLCLLFPDMPSLVPIHFDESGSADRLVPRAQSFVIPLIGLVTLLINSALGGVIYRHERMASYLLWGGTILVQILVWTAAIGILVRL